MNWLPPSIKWNPSNEVFGQFRPQIGAPAGEGRDSYSWITAHPEVGVVAVNG